MSQLTLTIWSLISNILMSTEYSANDNRDLMIVDQLESGIVIGDGKYSLIERTSFLGAPLKFDELPWSEVLLLPDPTVASSLTGVVPLTSLHIEAWAAFFRSEYYMSASAGRGAFGEVWRGIILDDSNTRVVLKRIYRSSESLGVASAMREVYFGEKINCLYTSRFLRHFIDQGDLWLVFRDEGVSLYQAVFKPVIIGELSIMRRSKFWKNMRSDPQLLIEIMLQIFHGISEIHKFETVHRDIKLENILIDPVTFTVRIGDFGSAYSMEDLVFPPPTPNEETARYSQAAPGGPVHLTPQYDLWCAGQVWIELFLGSIDLSRITHDLKNSIRKEDPLNQGMSEDVIDLIDRIRSGNISIEEILRSPVFPARMAASQGFRTQMEDYSLVSENNGDILACVMDGHNGSTVSAFIRSRFASLVWALRVKSDGGTILREAQVLLNLEVEKLIGTNSECGSTLSCLLKLGETIWISNVGDSRIVGVEHNVWEPQIGGEIEWEKNGKTFHGKINEVIDNTTVVAVPFQQEHRKTIVRNFVPRKLVKATVLTEDHKPGNSNEKNFIENNGGFVTLSTVPRLNGILAVSRSIGATKWKPIIRSEPDIWKCDLQNATFFLATDGIWDVVAPQEAAELGAPEAILARAIEAGGRDNMIIIHFDPNRKAIKQIKQIAPQVFSQDEL